VKKRVRNLDLIPDRSNTIFSRIEPLEVPVMQKLAAFFLKHSFKIMISGFVITTAGILYFIKMQNTALERTGFAVTVCGLCVWLFGRVSIIIQRRRLRRQRELEAGGQTGSET
jgi:hypothetical protein